MTGSVKKILMLGTNVSSIDAVRYLRSQGHHVTVTDNLPESSGAKVVANATASISTRDVKALTHFVRSQGFDALVAGINEGNIRSAITVSEELGLPFYCTSEQWEAMMNKDSFRDLCHRYRVPAPDTYFTGPGGSFNIEDHSQFPIIVKPVDGSSLSGISVCRNRDQLDAAVQNAVRTSVRGHIVIEEFVEGDEFTAAYVIVDGQAVLSSIDDRIPMTLPGMTTSFPALRVYPSAHLRDYIQACDAPVRQLFSQIGLQNACVYVQGIRSDSRTVVFEAGLRLAGEAPYRFIERVNGVNQLHHLMNASIGDTIDHNFSLEDPELGGSVCAIASFVLRSGTVDRIVGLERAITTQAGILDHEVRYRPGDSVTEDGTLRQIGLRFILQAPSREKLAEYLTDLVEGIDVLDASGVSLVAKFAPEDVLQHPHTP